MRRLHLVQLELVGRFGLQAIQHVMVLPPFDRWPIKDEYPHRGTRVDGLVAACRRSDIVLDKQRTHTTYGRPPTLPIADVGGRLCSDCEAALAVARLQDEL